MWFVHTCELPFIFGTTAFARTGNPDNVTIPDGRVTIQSIDAQYTEY
ncbi:hypothetical protein NKH71_11105 [Mesorhizobium sp. M0983]